MRSVTPAYYVWWLALCPQGEVSPLTAWEQRALGYGPQWVGTLTIHGDVILLDAPFWALWEQHNSALLQNSSPQLG